MSYKKVSIISLFMINGVCLQGCGVAEPSHGFEVSSRFATSLTRQADPRSTNDDTGAQTILPAATPAPARMGGTPIAPIAQPAPIVRPPPIMQPAPIAPIAQPAPITQPLPVVTQPAPAPASTGACQADVQALGWVGLASRERVQVGIVPTDTDPSRLGYPESYSSYQGFKFVFTNPYRVGSTSYSRRHVDYSADGYSIRITSLITNTSATVGASDMAPINTPEYVGAAFGVGSANEGVNHLFFGASQAFYERIRNFGPSNVSLYCNGSLVASGQQDVASIATVMAWKNMKSGNYRDGVPTYLADLSTLYGNVGISCPLESSPGASVTCSGDAIYHTDGAWYVDGVKVTSGFMNQLVIPNTGKKNVLVQLKVRYTNGIEDVSRLDYVKMK